MLLEFSAYRDERNSMEWGARTLVYDDDTESEYDNNLTYFETLVKINELQTKYGSQVHLSMGIVKDRQIAWINAAVII